MTTEVEEVVADFSFAWPSITDEHLEQIPGLSGFIAYAGGYGNGKNISRAKFQELMAAGLKAMLVIEDNAADLRGGAKVGRDQGKRLMAAGKVLGYDVDNCVAATGYDTDSHSGDWALLLAAMEAFAKVVPHPGYYGDSDSIDYLYARHPEWFYWQSNSTSFSPENPSPHAHLLQKWNDPRAHIAGLQSSIDINVVERTPLGFMGEEDDMPSAEELWSTPLTNAAGVTHQAKSWVMMNHAQGADNAAALTTISQLLAPLTTRVATVQKQLTTLTASVAALKPVAIAKADAAAIAAAVRDQVKTLVWGAK